MQCQQNEAKIDQSPVLLSLFELRSKRRMADTASPDQRGLYCSTSGTFFTDKDALADHYKSDFHRYAGLGILEAHTVPWIGRSMEQLLIHSTVALYNSTRMTYNLPVPMCSAGTI